MIIGVKGYVGFVDVWYGRAWQDMADGSICDSDGFRVYSV